ncbi:MAG: hypothetical protein WC333_08610 [Dehalococcoidia bacterium]|jgi:hypothetical protein
MAESDIVYVAVIPQDYPSINLSKAVAEIIGKDAYQARLLLAGSIPRIVARCVGAGAAEAMARKLREVGLTTIVCSDAELRKPFGGVRAKTMRFRERDVEFVQEDGRDAKLGVGSVFLIIKGTRQHVPEAEEDAPAKTKLKLSVGTSLIMGGIPVFKKVKEKPKSESSQPEWFLRLYERRSPDATVEILQYDIDYTFLGEETSLSSTANFMNVVKKLRGIYPQAIYDERLMKSFAADIPGTTADEDIDINCKLIYYQHLP